MARYEVLLLDFGGVCLRNPVELHDKAEQALGLAPGTFDWMGPLDPSTDPLWVEMTEARTLSERQYWAQRATEVGAAAGRDMDTFDYMALLYNPPGDELVRDEAVRVVEQARADDVAVSVLSNDLQAFHGPEWQSHVRFFELIDHIVDCSETNILKPDPRAYQRAIEIVGHRTESILFVDDQPGNVEGAREVGIDTIWFDIANPADAWQQVADQLGL